MKEDKEEEEIQDHFTERRSRDEILLVIVYKKNISYYYDH